MMLSKVHINIRVHLMLGIIWVDTNLQHHVPPLQHHAEQFFCPKNPVSSAYVSLFPSQPLELLIFLTVSIVLYFPACHITGIIQYIAFAEWLLSLNDMHLSFSMFFHDLIAHFFSMLNNIPLSRSFAAYSLTY